MSHCQEYFTLGLDISTLNLKQTIGPFFAYQLLLSSHYLLLKKQRLGRAMPEMLSLQRDEDDKLDEVLSCDSATGRILRDTEQSDISLSLNN